MDVDLDSLTVRARQRRRVLDQRQGEMRATLMQGKELQAQIQDLTESVEIHDRVTILLNSLGEDRQEKAQQTIEQLVTVGLHKIFDDSLSFHIVQTMKGKSSSVEFLVRTTLEDAVIETPVMEARGGGLAATVGFLLRLVVMLLGKGVRDENVLLLDETFAHVSAEYLEPLRQFLHEIVTKTGIQIMMVTHQPEFAEDADKVYRFTTEAGRTVVKEDG